MTARHRKALAAASEEELLCELDRRYRGFVLSRENHSADPGISGGLFVSYSGGFASACTLAAWGAKVMEARLSDKAMVYAAEKDAPPRPQRVGFSRSG